MINTFGKDIIPLNDEQRLEVLRSYEILDTPPEEVFNNIAHLIANVFDVPIALISLVDKERVFFKGNVGMEGVRNVDRGQSLCSLAVLSDEPTVILNALDDPCLLANPLVHGNFGLRFYAGAPLITSDGYNIGTVCLVDKKTRTFSEKEKEMLVRFSQNVMHSIESRLISQKKKETDKEIDLKNEQLQKLYKELQFVTDTIPQLAWSRNGAGKPVYLNKVWTEFTGYAVDELLQKDLKLVIHPEDADKVAAAWKLADSNKDKYEVEYRLRKHDGTYRWFLGRGTPMKDETGSILKWYGTSTDIQDHKALAEELEQKVKERTNDLEKQRNLLNNILRHSPSGITVYKAIRNSAGEVIDFQCILANDAAETFTGITNEERKTKTTLQITPELKDSPLLKKAITAVDDGVPFRTEYFNQNLSKWLELLVVNMHDDHLINVFRDITPIKEAHLQLKKNVDELKQANAELEHFAFAASHDMKEPIRKIHIFADRLQHSLGNNLTTDQKHYFDRMAAAARRMNSLIEDLLCYNRASQSQPFEQVDLNLVIKQVIKDLDLHIEEKGAVVNVHELCTVNGHQRQLQQVFHNLIDNALKYSKPNVAPQINISCKLIEANDQRKKYYQIDVVDNGIGFEQKDAERIFSVFQRLHNNEYRGTGLGLSIVRKVIEKHEGFITAESNKNEGSTFKILLPELEDMIALEQAS